MYRDDASVKRTMALIFYGYHGLCESRERSTVRSPDFLICKCQIGDDNKNYFQSTLQHAKINVAVANLSDSSMHRRIRRAFKRLERQLEIRKRSKMLEIVF